MTWPPVDEFSKSRAEGRYSAMLQLQAELNRILSDYYEKVRYQDDLAMAKAVVRKVEELVEDLNRYGYNLRGVDYAGDRDFEKSEQWFSNSKSYGLQGYGAGLDIRFRGFTAQVIWRQRQKKRH